MHIDEPFLKPVSNRQPFFDGSHEEHATLTFQCSSCRGQVQQNVLSFVSKASKWFAGLPTDDRQGIVELFDCEIGEYDGHPIVRAHGGGHPYFGLVLCGECSTNHLIYLTFYEKQYTRYIAILQGAARCTI